MKKAFMYFIVLCMLIFISACTVKEVGTNSDLEDSHEELSAQADKDDAQLSEESTDSLPYWTDTASDPEWPTESITTEEMREQIHEKYRKGYELIRGQPWVTGHSDTHVFENIQLLLSAISQLKTEELPRATYSEMKTAALSENMDTYVGELMYWASVYIDEVEEVPAHSELAEAVNAGREFCIVHTTTRHDESILLYVMDSDGISSWYRNDIERNSLKGWLVGTEQDAIVLCIPKLSGG